MKKIIVALSLAGFISLGFTVVNNTSSENGTVSTAQNSVSEDVNSSTVNNDKRLASWD
jgi:hypothetical protein